MFKLIKRLILAVVLLVIVAGVVLYFYSGSMIQSLIQTQATDSLKLKTTVGGAHLSPSLSKGSVSISDLAIASPEGYTTDHMFATAKVSVAMSYDQLIHRPNPMHIESIEVEDPRLVVEMDKDKNINIKTVSDSMHPDTSTDAKPGMQFVIDSLTIKNPHVTLKNFPGVPEKEIALDTIQLNNIGNGEGAKNGAAMQSIIAAIVAKMGDQTLLKMGADAALDSAKQALTAQVSSLEADVKSQLGSVLGNSLDLSKITGATSNPADLLNGVPKNIDPAKAIQQALPTSIPSDLGGGLNLPSLGGDKDKKKH